MTTATSTASPSATHQEIQIIKKAVANDFGVTPEDIDSISRTEPLPMIRHIAMALSYDITDASLPDVAKAFSRDCHGTVCHAIEATQSRCDISPMFKKRVERVSEEAERLVESARKERSK